MVKKMDGKNKRGKWIIEGNKAIQCAILFLWEITVIEKTAINSRMSKTLRYFICLFPSGRVKIIR